MVGVPGREPPGIVGLDSFLREHGSAVEADLQRYYRVALSDLFVGRLSWRRLAVLLRHLPIDSATVREVHGDGVAWDATQHLLATLIDVERMALWQRSGGRGKRPERMQRPGETRGHRFGRTTRSEREVRDFLARFRPMQNGGDTHASR